MTPEWWENMALETEIPEEKYFFNGVKQTTKLLPIPSLKIIQQLKSVAAQFLVDLLLFLSATQAYKELGLLFILVAVAILTFSRFDLDLDLQQLSQ